VTALVSFAGELLFGTATAVGTSVAALSPSALAAATLPTTKRDRFIQLVLS
jgi:hypothetical protein